MRVSFLLRWFGAGIAKTRAQLIAGRLCGQCPFGSIPTDSDSTRGVRYSAVGDTNNGRQWPSPLTTWRAEHVALPGSSDIDLFGYRDSVIHLDAQVPHGALDLGVAQEELNGTQVTRASIDQGSLGPPQRVGAVQMRV